MIQESVALKKVRIIFLLFIVKISFWFLYIASLGMMTLFLFMKNAANLEGFKE